MVVWGLSANYQEECMGDEMAEQKSPHGTRARYKTCTAGEDGEKCDACRDANTEYFRKYRSKEDSAQEWVSRSAENVHQLRRTSVNEIQKDGRLKSVDFHQRYYGSKDTDRQRERLRVDFPPYILNLINERLAEDWETCSSPQDYIRDAVVKLLAIDDIVLQGELSDEAKNLVEMMAFQRERDKRTFYKQQEADIRLHLEDCKKDGDLTHLEQSLERCRSLADTAPTPRMRERLQGLHDEYRDGLQTALRFTQGGE